MGWIDELHHTGLSQDHVSVLVHAEVNARETRSGVFFSMHPASMVITDDLNVGGKVGIKRSVGGAMHVLGE